jgi:cell division ATPase FtsA
VDLGGETTDITLWRAGRPMALSSLPTGANSVTHLLGRRWGLADQDAERLKRAHAAGLLDDDDRAQVLEVISPAIRVWVEGLEGALARLDQEQPLPSHIRLMGGGAALPEMVEAARALAWSEQLHFARYPQLGCLHPGDVPGVLNRTEFGRTVGDVSPLALAAWGARQGQSDNRPDRILEELCTDYS